MDNILAVIFMMIVIVQEIRHYLIVKDLLNRIMAKDYGQYVISNRQPLKKKHDVSDRILEDAEFEKHQQMALHQSADMNAEIDEQLNLLSTLKKHQEAAGVGRQKVG